MQPGRTLIVVGLTIVAVGVLWIVAERFGFGRLPGDLVIRKKNFTVYFPLVSSIVVSLVLTLLFNLFRR
jgi:hypothetical protein